jgi:SpoVK/Ycf46/Vps4 family AAA+-type ATPase
VRPADECDTRRLVGRAAEGEGGNARWQVTFFMRKGADVLSKWVGEAERQLKLLFEEAARLQPSIIFFDEIDGLAPVRSSRQDQIHNSIVSTLLALMDGLDPRGRVVVLGATNRPDAVDGALRRPGRFDRELGFTLPNLQARAAAPFTPSPLSEPAAGAEKPPVCPCGKL